jgi:hypothetical protein
MPTGESYAMAGDNKALQLSVNNLIDVKDEIQARGIPNGAVHEENNIGHIDGKESPSLDNHGHVIDHKPPLAYCKLMVKWPRVCFGMYYFPLKVCIRKKTYLQHYMAKVDIDYQ